MAGKRNPDMNYNIETASFNKILSTPGIGKVTLEKLVKEAGRWDEYQEWLQPIAVEVDGEEVEITKNEIKSKGNLTSTMRLLGFDPNDPEFAGGTFKERSLSARRAFKNALDAGKITERDIALTLAKMKIKKEEREFEEDEDLIQGVSGVRRDSLSGIYAKIRKHYESLVKTYPATTPDIQQQLLHVASIFANREFLQETFTKLNSESVDKKDVARNARVMNDLTTQISRMTSEINSILSGFKRRDDLESDPREYITQTMAQGKKGFQAHSLPVTCPKCHNRYGFIAKFFPRDVAPFPVIKFTCKWKDASTKKECGGEVVIDIDKHLDEQGVVLFTYQNFFDPSMIGKDVDDDEIVGALNGSD